MIVHTLNMCTGNEGPEQSLVLFKSVQHVFADQISFQYFHQITIPAKSFFIPTTGFSKDVYCFLYILRPSYNRSPYIFTLGQKVKNSNYKIYAL